MNVTLQAGNRVGVVRGEYKGETGVVTKIASSCLYVTLDSTGENVMLAYEEIEETI